MDYAALVHIHLPVMFPGWADGRGLYAGCPVALEFGDDGERRVFM
jgi:hypothetical protein